MTIERFRWTPPSDQELNEELASLDSHTMEERVARCRFIYHEFGPDVDMLIWGGIPAYTSLFEMKSSFLFGNYLSTILNAHIFLEQSLGASLIMMGFEKEAEQNLSSIISKALDLGVIDEHLKERIDELRQMRIAYFHVHSGLKERSYMGRFMRKKFADPFTLLEADAKEAVMIVVDVIRHQNPNFHRGCNSSGGCSGV